MRTNVQAWPLLLLLLAATSSWAVDHHVVVGGTTAGGGYYGGGNTPVLSFTPANLTIAVGDTVTFTSAGGAAHNVHADDNSFRCAQGCDGDGGNGTPSDALWTSTVTFNQAGTFGYHCDVHVSMGMTGSITVQGATASGNVPITAGFTGAWYDPNQSGQGLFLEVLPDNVLMAAWYAFTPDGTQQAWFTGLGNITNDTAVVTEYLTTGGAWIPNFDPSTIVNNPWGTLTFTFTDCGHGRVDFTSTYLDYGANHMDLTRLTQPVGITCP